MALSSNLISKITFTAVVLFSLLLAGKSQTFPTTLPGTTLQLGSVNITHLHFFFHDPNGASFWADSAPVINTSATTVVGNEGFLTVGPEPNSTRVGRSQVVYVSMNTVGGNFMMIQNFNFEEEGLEIVAMADLGDLLTRFGQSSLPLRLFNGTGSPLRVINWDAEARTYSLNTTNNDAIVEYNV